MGLHTPAHKFIDKRFQTVEDYEKGKVSEAQSRTRTKLTVAQVQQILAEEDLGEWEAGQVFSLNINNLR